MTLLPVIASLRHAAVFFVMGGLMLIIKEQFPFSHFPMYSVLPDHTECVQLVDGEGRIIPIVPVFGGAITVLKKQLIHEMRMQEDSGAFKKRSEAPPEAKQAAGAKVLKWLLTHFPPRDPTMKGKVIRLQQVSFSIKNSTVVRTVETLAEDRI